MKTMMDFERKINFERKSNDLITIGELLIDMISEDYSDDHRGRVYHRYFGGSPSNVAINAKRLGIKSKIAAAVDNDGLGDYLIQTLLQEDMDISTIQRVDESTSMVLISKSKSTPNPIFYRHADFRLQYNDHLANVIRDSKILHFTCWPISMEPARKSMEKCLNEARKHHLLIGFDPNYHPKLWNKDENATDYIKSMMACIDIVKPSLDDAERLFGKDTVENHVRSFLDLGVKLVVMTLGKDGAIVSNGEKTNRSSISKYVIGEHIAGTP